MARISFAVVVDSDVTGTITIDENNFISNPLRKIAAYRSNPVVIETENKDVQIGWIWDGSSFLDPKEN